MTLLYLTADVIGTPSGGGLVTFHESEALKQLGECLVWDRTQFPGGSDPWGWDQIAYEHLRDQEHRHFDLVHVYSGSFPATISALKNRTRPPKVTWTIAAHDKEVSRREHEQLGLTFGYPHLVEEPLWRYYIEGYRLADVIICPSTVAANTVRSYGPTFTSKDIRVVPHGCTLPEAVAPLPASFRVGYMGSFGADKGLRYLLAAWKKLAYRDATLVLAGRDSTSPWARHLIQTYGGGNIQCLGWMTDPADFYNSISCYVQPSATEGFGIEVLESLSHERPVLCSAGAGASDLAGAGVTVFAVGDVEHLCYEINCLKESPANLVGQGHIGRCAAAENTWPIIHKKYQEVWRSIL